MFAFFLQLNVGDDALNESDLSSVPSSARPREEEQLGASAAANDGAESKGDHMDASLRRFSKRSSALHMSSDNDVDVNVDADADAGVNNSGEDFIETHNHFFFYLFD